MTDNDLETLYKNAVAISHFAGLREVYDAGFQAGANQSVTPLTPDASLTQTPPSTDVTISTV